MSRRRGIWAGLQGLAAATGLALVLGGCASLPPEEGLTRAINDYRERQGLAAIPRSPALAEVAEAHLKDIRAHDPGRRECSLHSWSDKGAWTPCCYTAGEPASARCMRDKPRELTGSAYPHAGFEIVAWRSEAMTAQAALDIWRGSPAHDAVVVNKGVWSALEWRAIGAAMSDEYAIVWFGREPDRGAE